MNSEQEFPTVFFLPRIKGRQVGGIQDNFDYRLRVHGQSVVSTCAGNKMHKVVKSRLLT